MLRPVRHHPAATMHSVRLPFLATKNAYATGIYSLVLMYKFAFNTEIGGVVAPYRPSLHGYATDSL